MQPKSKPRSNDQPSVKSVDLDPQQMLVSLGMGHSEYNIGAEVFLVTVVPTTVSETLGKRK